MLNLRKKALGLALATAILGGGISTAQAVVRAPDGIGQVLLYPYFTVNAGWRTFIHFTNTSDSTLPVKVRFHRASDSLDILDFIVVLSPHDMWTAVVESQGGQAGVRATDNTCTVPILDQDTHFQPFLTQATEGYVEVIALGRSDNEGSLNDPNVAWNATHATSGATEGIPRDCQAVEQAFGPSKIEETDDQFSGGPTGYLDVLTGKFDLINVQNGWAGASRAVTLAEFGHPFRDFMRFPQVTGTTSDFPNLDSANETTASDNTTVWGVFATNNALNATSVINEWVLNRGLEERSSWVLTFPTQALTTAAVAAVNAWRAAQTPPLTGLANNFLGAQTVNLSLYNREEKIKEVGFSGGAATTLANEVNVIDFIDSKIGVSAANILSSGVSKTIDTAALQSPFAGGWLQLGLPNNTVILADSLTDPIAFDRGAPGEGMGHAYTTSDGGPFPRGNINAAVANIVPTAVTGRPVIGFNITQRSIPTENASLYEHAYTRWVAP